ncbi:MAG: T9SS type A sorting domain-containing protein, partial [Bacteroidota bacterium]
DPWVTSVTTLLASNAAFDVDYDFAGNTFIYGGQTPFKIAKYDPNGILLWTFSGTLTSPSWSTSSYASNIAVNKFNSKVYTGQGFMTSASVIRLDASGNYDNFITLPNVYYNEVWDIGFNCTSGDPFIFGGSTSSNSSGATINMTSGSLTLASFQGSATSCCWDIVNYAIDEQGKIFAVYASASNTLISNKICLINPGFNGNIWTQATGFNSLQEAGNKSAYTYSLFSNGYNCLAVNGTYLFYYDGLNLAVYSKQTGLALASTTVSTSGLKKEGGIAVDNCNKIYLGGNNTILTYSFNGTGFIALSPIFVGTNTVSPQDIYDLKLDKSNNLLYFSGNGVVGCYTVISGTGCNTNTLVISPSQFSICSGQTISLTVSGAGSYTWSTGSNSNAIIVSPIVNTSYSVNGITSSICGNSSGTGSINIFVNPSPSLTVAMPPKFCLGEIRTVTVSGASSYSWNTGATSSTINVNSNSNLTFTVTGTNPTNSCTTQKMFTVSVSPCTSISESIANKAFARVFPNPSNKFLTLELINQNEKIKNVSLYNSIGEQVFQTKKISLNSSNQFVIDISAFANGLYYLEVQNETRSLHFNVIKE